MARFVSKRSLLASLALGGLVALGVSAAASQNGTQLWSGDWTTSTGAFGLRHDTAGVGAPLLKAIGGKPCAPPSDYFDGGYYDPPIPPGDAGKLRGCTKAPYRLVGRYQSDYRASNAGSFDITIVGAAARNTFKGTYTPDGGKPVPWSGSFQKDFAGDGANDPLAGANAGPAGAGTAHLEWKWAHGYFTPLIATLKNHATVRLCNSGDTYTKPFTLSGDTTLPKNLSLAPGRCVSFTVHNPTKGTIRIRFGDDIHSRDIGYLYIRPQGFR
jgi:hypothetical protein